MPFKSDKQRRYLWSQKPDVARKFAKHMQQGGYSAMASLRNKELEQQELAKHNALRALHASKPGMFGNEYIPPKEIVEQATARQGVLMPGVQKQATLPHQGSYKQQNREQLDYLAEQAAANELLKQKAAQQGFKFNHGGDVPMMDGRKPKKVTQKDRYGNEVVMEYEPDVKPLDPTELAKEAMKQGGDVPMMSIGMADGGHPGEPKGTDTVPAWLTPGEFVVNKEAVDMYGPQIEAMNDHGRQVQNGVSYKQLGGLQESYDSAFQSDNRTPLPDSIWWDQQSLDAIENAIPDPIKKGLLLLNAAKQGEVSLDKSWKFEEGGPVDMPQSYLDTLLHSREGFRDDVYLDSLGKPTVGAGHLLGNEYLNRVGEKPFSKAKLMDMFGEDRDKAIEGARRNVGPKFDDLNKKQQAALVSMSFQLGEKGQSKFKNLLKALKSGDHKKVAMEALTGSSGGKSKWLKQTPKRALDLAEAFSPGISAQYKAGGGVVYADIGKEIMDTVFGNAKLRDSQALMPDDDIWANNIPQDDSTSMTSQQAGIPKAFSMEDFGPQGIGEGQEQGVPSKYNQQPTSGIEVPYDEGLDIEGALPGEITKEAYEDDEELVDSAEYLQKPKSAKINPRKLNNNKTAITRAEELLKNTPTDSIYWETRAKNLQRLKAQDAADRDNIDKWNEYEAAIATGQKQKEDKLKEVQKNEAVAQLRETGNNELADQLEDQYNEEKNAEIVDDSSESNKSKDEVKDSVLDTIINKPLDNNETGPGPDQPGENQDADAVENKGTNTSPKEKKAAEGFLKSTFGDLFDTGELKRMAIMYLGSRALGYSHGGSLQFAAKQYVNRVDTKTAAHAKRVQELAKSGKWTPASIAEYQKTKDISQLIPAGQGMERTGTYKTFYGGGKQVKAEQVKVGDQTYWVDANGKRVDGTQFTDDPTSVKGTKEYRDRINTYRSVTTDQLKSLRNQFDKIGVGDNISYLTDINPATSAGEISKWAMKNNVDPEELAGLVESAYHDALNDDRQDERRVRDLVPYLNNLVIRNQVTSPQAFLLDDQPDKGPAKYIDGEKMASLNRAAATLMNSVGKKGNEKQLTNLFYDAVISDWNQLTTKEQENWQSKAKGSGVNGFYLYAQSIAEEQFMKRK